MKVKAQRSRWAWLLLLMSAMCVPITWAQINRGTITGTVTDPTGAVVPDAKVIATNIETGVNYSGVTTGAGVYSIVDLPTGRYDLHLTSTGFRTFERTGIALEVGQVARVDVKLAIGSTSEAVTVNGAPPQLDTETATVGTNISGKAMKELPFSIGKNAGRNASLFAFSTMPTVEGGNYSSHIQGSPGMTKQVLIDGTQATAGLQGFVNEPGMEALQSIEVQTNSISAEAGATGGGVLLYEMKSGTNQLHGSAYGFLANEVLNANTWTNNWWKAQDPSKAAKYKRPRNRFKDYGFSGGGPLWKNHTFLFADYELYDASDYTSNDGTATVPTTDFLQGDFSKLLDRSVVLGKDPAGNPIYKGAIFDPATGDVFPGNVIPTNRISAQSLKILNLYKSYAPTVAGNLINNYPSVASGAPSWKVRRYDAKLDHNFSDRNHAFASFNWWDQPRLNSGGLWQAGSLDGGPLNAGNNQNFNTYGIRASDSHTISPTLVNVFAWSFNMYHVDEQPNHSVSPKSLGFTGFDGVSSTSNNLPIINFGPTVNGIAETAIGNRFSDYYQFTGHDFKDTLSWTKGRHTLKFGGEYERLGAASDFYGGVQTYNFTNQTGVPLDPKIYPFVGFGFANFLLGDVQSASMTTGNPQASHRQLFDAFIQDDIKVTPSLTINVSLRWDVNFPLYEDRGRWTQFDVTAQNPAWAPYKGAWDFANNGDTTFIGNNDYHEFSPHIGVAYKVGSKAVIRGGFGRYYVPLGQNYWKAVPFASDYGFVGNSAVNNYVQGTTAFNWDSGYPGAVTFPARNPNDTYLVSPLVYYNRDYLHMGHTNNWNVGMEYQLTTDTVLSLNYLGNQGRNLHDGTLTPYNFPTQSDYASLLASGHVNQRITSAADAATAGVPYPYAGFTGYAYQAISPYPQVRATNNFINYIGSPLGVSSYNALVVEGRKRGGNGLTLDLSYTFSKATTNVSDMSMDEGGAYQPFQNPYAYAAEGNVVAAFDQTHIVKGYVTYELPFGHGKRWLSGSRALNYLVGGWTIGTQLRYNSGSPMGFVGSSNSYPGWSAVYANIAPNADLSNQFKNVNLAWNGAPGTDPGGLFFNPQSFSNPQYGQFGNQPRKYDNWRGWGYADEDLSLLKAFAFGRDGRYRATLRAEFFNVFNRHYFGQPNMTINSPYFGHITTASGNRTGQVGARFEF